MAAPASKVEEAPVAKAPENRAFIGNIPWSVDEDGLKSHFASAGTIIGAEVIRSGKENRSRGFGYVQFSDAAGVAACVESFNGTQMGEREIRVEAEAPRERTKKPRRRRRKAAAEGETKAAAAPAPEEETKAEPSNRVYIGNVSYDSTDEGVSGVVSGQAGFQSAAISRATTGRSKGFAYAVFDTVENALAAAQALSEGDEVVLDERPLRFEPERTAKPKRRRNRKKKAAATAAAPAPAPAPVNPAVLYVGNIPYDTTEETLRTTFSPHGEIESINLASYSSGRAKGYGYVTFTTAEAAAAAVGALNGVDLGERPMRVEIKQRKARARRARASSGAGGSRRRPEEEA